MCTKGFFRTMPTVDLEVRTPASRAGAAAEGSARLNAAALMVMLAAEGPSRISPGLAVSGQ